MPSEIIGRITRNQLLKASRKAPREIELEANGGRWIAKNKVHKNKKAYTRKQKHKTKY